MRILKSRELVRPRTRNTRETRTTAITLSGRWLEKLGFEPESTFFVDDSQLEKLIIYAKAPPEAQNTLTK